MMKKILVLLVAAVLFSCSADEPIIKYYKIKYEVLSTNSVDAFFVKYYYNTLETSFSSEGKEIWNEKEWTKIIETSTPDILDLQLTVLVGHVHTTTLNIYVDNEIKKSETFTGSAAEYHSIYYRID